MIDVTNFQGAPSMENLPDDGGCSCGCTCGCGCTDACRDTNFASSSESAIASTFGGVKGG